MLGHPLAPLLLTIFFWLATVIYLTFTTEPPPVCQ